MKPLLGNRSVAFRVRASRPSASLKHGSQSQQCIISRPNPAAVFRKRTTGFGQLALLIEQLILFAFTLILVPVGISLAQTVPLTEQPPLAYVTNSGDGTVSVIDTVSNKVLTTIAVGQEPIAVAVAPDRDRAYIANYRSNSVSVIDTTTNTVLDTIPVGVLPRDLAVTPDGTRVYAVNSSAFSDSISVINTATNEVITTIPVGEGPMHIAITPDGSRAYVTNFASNTVSVVDLATNRELTTIEARFGPVGVTISPNGARAYVTINTISIFIPSFGVVAIDTASNTVLSTTQVPGRGASDIAMSPDGSRLYLPHRTNAGPLPVVSVIDTENNALLPGIPLRGGTDTLLEAIALSPNGTRAYVAKSSSNSISVIDTATRSELIEIPVGLSPFGVALTSVPPHISNGSFERGANPGATFITLPAGSAAMTDWVVAGGTVEYIGPYWAAAVGQRSVDLNGNNPGAISQVFQTHPGTTYAVQFALAGNPDGGPTTKRLQVSADRETAELTFNTAGRSRQDMGYEKRTFLFTAKNAETTLTFQSLTAGPYGPAIDNVTVNETALVNVNNLLLGFVPENRSYKMTAEPAGCPSGFVGKFSFEATLAAKNGSPPLSSIVIRVAQLSNGNLLQNADGGPSGVGGLLTIPRNIDTEYVDGSLTYPENIRSIPFTICLMNRLPFNFLVDVLGTTGQ